MGKTILRNIVVCYQNKSPSQTFSWGKFNLHKFQEIVSGGVTVEYNYSLQCRTLVLCHECFDEIVLK